MELTNLEIDSQNALQIATSFEIANNSDYTAVDHHCTGLAALEKEIKNQFADPKQKAASAHKAIVAMEARLLDPIADARRLDKAKMSVWRAKQAEADRLEKIRLEAEALKDAEYNADQAIHNAEMAGDTEKATAIAEAGVVVDPVYLQNSAPKIATILRTTWKYKIIDEALIPREFLTPDTVKIGKYARAMAKDAKISGVEFYSEVV